MLTVKNKVKQVLKTIIVIVGKTKTGQELLHGLQNDGNEQKNGNEKVTDVTVMI